MPYWNGCATAKPNQPVSQRTHRQGRSNGTPPSRMYWCVNNTHIQNPSLPMYLSLARSYSYSLLFTFALHVCFTVVAVLSLFISILSVQKSMELFDVQGCNCSNMKNPKKRLFQRSKSMHAYTQAHSIQAMNC